MEKKEKAPSVADSFDAAEVDEELDPVALNKAFRFAAWSSLGLVSPLTRFVNMYSLYRGCSSWCSSSSSRSRSSSRRRSTGRAG
jgi:hypothetical protein